MYDTIKSSKQLLRKYTNNGIISFIIQTVNARKNRDRDLGELVG